jgi:hypothetical protein
MSMLAAWVAYPLVLLAICGGLGLLLDAICGKRLPGALIFPAGLAMTIVIAQFPTRLDATAELTVPLLLLPAALGLVLSLPWRFGRPNPWAVGVPLAVFLVFGAPVIFTGHPTFTGYIKLDDTATWFALTDRVMEHGRSIAGLEPSTYQATLHYNLASGYPVGVFLPFGAAQEIVGGDLAWVFQPYLAFLAAMLSLSIWEILRIPIRRPGPRSAAAFLAAQPALLYGYALWGGVKEIAAAALVALAAALAPAAVGEGARRRDALPLAVAAGALVGVLSLGGLIWLAPMLIVLAVLAVRRFGGGGAVKQALAFVLPLAVLVVPVVTTGLVPPTSSPLTDPHAEGNLRGPLEALQVLGIWPNGDFRFDPHAIVLSAILIALGLAAACAGLWVSWARRNLVVLLYATTLLACFAIVLIGSPWAGGKALATASPVALSLAVLGAYAAWRTDIPTGVVLGVVIAFGVLWSNALAYRDAWVAPYGELHELQKIGEEFSGEGPTLMTEYSPFGARHFLRNMNTDSVSELRSRSIPLANGEEVEPYFSADTDELNTEHLLFYRTLVLRRSPASSRPPLPYRRVWRGDAYEVWQRPETIGLPPEHMALGTELDPAAVPNCSEVGGLSLLPLLHQIPNAHLVAARHGPVYNATEGTLWLPHSGTYVPWLRGLVEYAGSIGGRVEVTVDGKSAGEVRNALENEGSYVHFDAVHLGKGLHHVRVKVLPADLHPGSGAGAEPGTLLFARAHEPEGLVEVSIDDANRLCGKRWDWIEAVGG